MTIFCSFLFLNFSSAFLNRSVFDFYIIYITNAVG